ncbi:unnamed protein product [Adineta steineri]|uniref:Uncharacterized protein n=2 Tax=Adineta steineri TaxID=433720 RepID=A0A815G5X3_9BILA|nr:unnamed protein product [Adineta steineri]
MNQYRLVNGIGSIISNKIILAHQNVTNTDDSLFSWTNGLTLSKYGSLETTVQCVGPLYNQSCLYKNLYYVNKTFLILIVNGRTLPPREVRYNAFGLWDNSPTKYEFPSYKQLDRFVRQIANPMIIPDVTVFFSQSWHYNIAHALFDGLYPAYLALIRFTPRHLHPFRLLVHIDPCNLCWSEDVYSRFAGLGIIKLNVLERMSTERWYMFDELIMGTGNMCQRCIQPNYQLPGGIELNGSKLFRDRMYKQHGLFLPVTRQKNSSEGRHPRYPLNAYIIDNKRFTENDRKEIYDAINEINNYTNTYLNILRNNIQQLEWPLVRISYLSYNLVKTQYNSSVQFNTTSIDSRPPAYELTENDFMAQLRKVQVMDIHISGPGTGQFYQVFLPDGSVTINLGAIRPWPEKNPKKMYTSFFEEYLTSGTPYIKGLYYPMNKRWKGIKKEEIIKLVRRAAQMIMNGFSIPVNPRDNLASDGQLFTEMCERDKDFCNLVTIRSGKNHFACTDVFAEDIIHEYKQWNIDGYMDGNKTIRCPLNRTLLRELRQKYGIYHYVDS